MERVVPPLDDGHLNVDDGGLQALHEIGKAVGPLLGRADPGHQDRGGSGNTCKDKASKGSAHASPSPLLVFKWMNSPKDVASGLSEFPDI